MPHIQIRNAAPLEEFVQSFQPIDDRFETAICKTSAVYLNARDRSALVQALVVEPHVRRKFYMLLTERPDSVMVRIDPMTDPEKTPAVKHLLALVAAQLRDGSPGAEYGTTNIEDSLIR